MRTRGAGRRRGLAGLALVATCAVVACRTELRWQPAMAPNLPAPGTLSSPDIVMFDAGAAVATVDVVRRDATEEDAAYLTGGERRGRLVRDVNEWGDVRSCWLQAVARTRGHRPERIRVNVSVTVDGTATVAVQNSNDERLTQCIEQRLRAHRYGPGEAMSVPIDFSLDPQG